jgi:hypothetical protein
LAFAADDTTTFNVGTWNMNSTIGQWWWSIGVYGGCVDGKVGFKEEDSPSPTAGFWLSDI